MVAETAVGVAALGQVDRVWTDAEHGVLFAEPASASESRIAFVRIDAGGLLAPPSLLGRGVEGAVLGRGWAAALDEVLREHEGLGPVAVEVEIRSQPRLPGRVMVLANLVAPLLTEREDEARELLREVFNLSADLVPDPQRGRLVVRLYSMDTPRANRALAALCASLNDSPATFPGTRLRLHLEPPGVT